MNDENCKLIQAFFLTIKEHLPEVAVDFSEDCIDELLDNELLKNVPIIKSVIAVGKTAISIRDRYLCIRILSFLQEFESDSLSDQAIQNHIDELNDEKYLKRELEQVLHYIDLCTHNMQANILARLYLAYLKKEITWEVFGELGEANRRMFIRDYKVLKDIVLLGYKIETNDNSEVSISRLSSLGLVFDSRLKSGGGAIMVSEDYINGGLKASNLGFMFSRYIYNYSNL